MVSSSASTRSPLVHSWLQDLSTWAPPLASVPPSGRVWQELVLTSQTLPFGQAPPQGAAETQWPAKHERPVPTPQSESPPQDSKMQVGKGGRPPMDTTAQTWAGSAQSALLSHANSLSSKRGTQAPTSARQRVPGQHSTSLPQRSESQMPKRKASLALQVVSMTQTAASLGGASGSAQQESQPAATARARATTARARWAVREKSGDVDDMGGCLPERGLPATACWKQGLRTWTQRVYPWVRLEVSAGPADGAIGPLSARSLPVVLKQAGVRPHQGPWCATASRPRKSAVVDADGVWGGGRFCPPCLPCPWCWCAPGTSCQSLGGIFPCGRCPCKRRRRLQASGFRLQASGLRATAPHLCTWTPVLRISAVCPRAVATRVRPLSAAPCRRRPLPRRDRLVPLPLRRMRARSRIGGRKNGFGVDDSKLPRRADPHRRTQRAGCTLSARARRPFTRLSTSGVACFVAGRCVCAQS